MMLPGRIELPLIFMGSTRRNLGWCREISARKLPKCRGGVNTRLRCKILFYYNSLRQSYFLEHHHRAVEPLGVRRTGIARNDADDLVAERAIERLAANLLAGIEGQQRPPFLARDALELDHQPPPDAFAARLRMDHHLRDVGAMALVGHGVEAKLNRSHHVPALARGKQAAGPGGKPRRDLVAPECPRIVQRERQDETDVAATM